MSQSARQEAQKAGEQTTDHADQIMRSGEAVEIYIQASREKGDRRKWDPNLGKHIIVVVNRCKSSRTSTGMKIFQFSLERLLWKRKREAEMHEHGKRAAGLEEDVSDECRERDFSPVKRKVSPDHLTV